MEIRRGINIQVLNEKYPNDAVHITSNDYVYINGSAASAESMMEMLTVAAEQIGKEAGNDPKADREVSEDLCDMALRP